MYRSDIIRPMPFDDFIPAQKNRFLAELTEFLAIPSISTLSTHRADCLEAATWVADHLRALGCPRVELRNGSSSRNPVVWAEGPTVPGRPVLLVYGHYDVQPVEPLAEWTTPPFTPTVRDGKIFARGAADDKGQVYCLLKAFEAAGQAHGAPLNLRFLIEGEEESGGETIADLLQAAPELARADAILICDMPYAAPGVPAVYTALRGMCYAEIRLRTLKRDLHSGLYGGAAPNAHEELVRLLAQLKRADGRIRIPGLYDDVVRPSRGEREGWKRLPFRERTFMRDEVGARALTGIQRATVLERLWALPTFEIHGIAGGFTGEGAKTVIPAEASAKVSLRLVPNQRAKRVQRQLKSAIRKLKPPWAEVDVSFVHGADPVQVDTGAAPFRLLDQAFEEVVGRAPVLVRGGGSIPIVLDLAKEGAPVILTGIGLPDDQLHAPNEKLDLQQLWDGIGVFARFFELLGASGES